LKDCQPYFSKPELKVYPHPVAALGTFFEKNFGCWIKFGCKSVYIFGNWKSKLFIKKFMEVSHV
jgi:hypothetical protein